MTLPIRVSRRDFPGALPSAEDIRGLGTGEFGRLLPPADNRFLSETGQMLRDIVSIADLQSSV